MRFPFTHEYAFLLSSLATTSFATRNRGSVDLRAAGPSKSTARDTVHCSKQALAWWNSCLVAHSCYREAATLRRRAALRVCEAKPQYYDYEYEYEVGKVLHLTMYGLHRSRPAPLSVHHGYTAVLLATTPDTSTCLQQIHVNVETTQGVPWLPQIRDGHGVPNAYPSLQSSKMIHLGLSKDGQYINWL